MTRRYANLMTGDLQAVHQKLSLNGLTGWHKVGMIKFENGNDI